MKINGTITNEAFCLNGKTIAKIDGLVEEFAVQLKMERNSILRTRISVEEILLRWMDHFGEECPFSFSMGYRWRTPYLSMELPGEACNPLIECGDEDELNSILLTKLGLQPHYTYEKGKNCVYFSLEKRRRNPAVLLLFSVAVALFVGLGGREIFPAQVLDTLSVMILAPIYNAFLRLLNLAAGPVTFLSVLSIVYELGNMSVLGNLWNKMCRRFIGLCFLLSALSAWLCLRFFTLQYLHDPISTTDFSSTLDLLLHIIPNDILTPFIEGSSPSLILLAIFAGDILLSLNRQGQNTVLMAAQSGFVMQRISDNINTLSGYMIFVILLLHLWTNAMQGLKSLWRPLLLCALLYAVYLLIALLYISWHFRLSPGKLAGKLKASFLLALTTASMTETHRESVSCCEKKLGISPVITRYGIPLGSTIYMPGVAINMLIISLYMAEQYQVPISFLWLLIAVFLSTILAIASPPISGASLLTYAVIFSQLGIPTQALGIAMMADILMGFMAVALDQAFLQLEMTLLADDAQLLDKERLHSNV